MFTSLDKSLMDRAIRYILEQASQLKAKEAPAGIWPKTQEGRKAKRLFDIYGRDAADLKALQARLIRDHADKDLQAQLVNRKARKQKTEQVQEAKPPVLTETVTTANPGPAVVAADREHPLGSAPGPEQTESTGVQQAMIAGAVAAFSVGGVPDGGMGSNVEKVTLTPPEEKLLDAAEVLFNGNPLAVVGTAEEKF